MEYTEEQIQFIQAKKPELGFKEVPSLDSVIVEFLRKYEVFVVPPNKKDLLGGAITGAVTGMAGADVGGDMAMIQGQNKQTKMQEWTSWKQWALDHKDFESIKLEKFDNPKAHNLKVLESLKDPKVQKELEPIMEEYKKIKELERKEVRTYRTIFGVILSIFIVIPVIGVCVFSFWPYIENNRQENFLLIK